MPVKRGKQNARSGKDRVSVSSSKAIGEANGAEENVFLFVPNLIGASTLTGLLSCDPRCGIALLYAR